MTTKLLTDDEIRRILQTYNTIGIAGEKECGKSVLDAMFAHAQNEGEVIVIDALGVFNPLNDNKTAAIPGSAYYPSPDAFIQKQDKSFKKHVINFSKIKNRRDKIIKMDELCDHIEGVAEKEKNKTQRTLIIDEAADFIPQKGKKSESLEYTIKNGRNWLVLPTILTTQRPQRIDKDSFELSNAYIIFNQMGKNTLDRLVEITNAEDPDSMETRIRGLEKRHFLLVHKNDIQEYKIPEYKFAFKQHR